MRHPQGASRHVTACRDKEHSTIIYESPQPDTPLLRLGWNKQDPRYMATISMDSSRVVVLDIRYALSLQASQSNVAPCGTASPPPQLEEKQALQNAGKGRGSRLASIRCQSLQDNQMQLTTWNACRSYLRCPGSKQAGKGCKMRWSSELATGARRGGCVPWHPVKRQMNGRPRFDCFRCAGIPRCRWQSCRGIRRP